MFSIVSLIILLNQEKALVGAFFVIDYEQQQGSGSFAGTQTQ